MQLRLPWDRVRAEPPARRHQLVVAGESIDLEIARHIRARRYVLRVRDDGHLRLTVPRGASIAGGLRFADRQHDWIIRERHRLATRRQPWQAGAPVWFRGCQTTLAVQDDGTVRIGETVLGRPRRDGDLKTFVEGRLRAMAERELIPRCAALAIETGVRVTRVSVRNQRSRWGACSSRGSITLNWRLLQMPPNVSDYVIFHELMHRRQPNHSRRFWREVASVCPGWRDAEKWLRRHGKDLL